MAYSSQQFSAGTISQAIANPLSTEAILVQNLGPGTVVIGQQTGPGPSPQGLQVTAASGIVTVPVQNFGGAANADDQLYARCTQGGTAVVNVLLPT